MAPIQMLSEQSAIENDNNKPSVEPWNLRTILLLAKTTLGQVKPVLETMEKDSTRGSVVYATSHAANHFVTSLLSTGTSTGQNVPDGTAIELLFVYVFLELIESMSSLFVVFWSMCYETYSGRLQQYYHHFNFFKKAMTVAFGICALIVLAPCIDGVDACSSGTNTYFTGVALGLFFTAFVLFVIHLIMVFISNWRPVFATVVEPTDETAKKWATRTTISNDASAVINDADKKSSEDVAEEVNVDQLVSQAIHEKAYPNKNKPKSIPDKNKPKSGSSISTWNLPPVIPDMSSLADVVFS